MSYNKTFVVICRKNNNDRVMIKLIMLFVDFVMLEHEIMKLFHQCWRFAYAINQIADRSAVVAINGESGK